MESNRNHLFEYKSGRLNFQDIGFNGPGSEAFRLDLLLNRDCDILVPRNLPVDVGYFVEEYSLYREGPRTENCLD
jgi:hypothetical protein